MDEQLARKVKSINDIRQMYRESSEKRGFNALIYGDMGTGKTTLAETCRQPILVHSFDPNGSMVLRDGIEAGYIIADNRFEVEDPKSPSAFRNWDQEYHRLKKEGMFDIFGTYFFDSLTTFSQIVMNFVLGKNGRPGGIPEAGAGKSSDYVLQMNFMEIAIRDFFTLPCDVIITAHPDVNKDDVTGKMYVGPLVTGQLKTRLPLLFDELYYLLTSKDAKGEIKRALLTQPDGSAKAKTRLGMKGRFNTFEEPDIKGLLKKSGLTFADKTIPWLQGT